MPTRHVTLTEDEVENVALASGDFATVAVWNRGTTSDAIVTVNGDDPVEDADDTYPVPPGTRRRIPLPSSEGPAAEVGRGVRVLCAEAARVEVEFS